MKRFLSFILGIYIILTFIGCNNDHDSSAVTTLKDGYYLDSAVSGIKYKCGEHEGITDKEGRFKFQDNDSCILSISDILLKEITADSLTDGIKVVEDNATIAAFLQTLDKDGNVENGIEITEDIVNTLKTAKVKTIPQNEAELATIYNRLKNDVDDYKGSLVTTDEASKHMEATLTSVTKNMMEGKTFYAVHIDNNGQHFIVKVSFDKDMTQMHTEGILNTDVSLETSIDVVGNKINQPLLNSYTIVEQKRNYIFGLHYTENLTLIGDTYIFQTQQEAEKFYSDKFPDNTPIIYSGQLPDLSEYTAFKVVKNVSYDKYLHDPMDKSMKKRVLAPAGTSCPDLGLKYIWAESKEPHNGVFYSIYYDGTKAKEYYAQKYCLQRDWAISDHKGDVTYVEYGWSDGNIPPLYSK